MKFLKYIVIATFLTGLLVTTQAQSEWKTAKTFDNRISVKYRIIDRDNEEGKKDQVLDYVVTTIANKPLDAFVRVLKDPTTHKDFLDSATKSTLIKKISENEWIEYYYFNIPWPMQDADCVLKMQSNYDMFNKTFTATGVAEPNLIKASDIFRIKYYNVKYAIKALSENQSEITMSLQMTPATQAPGWMVMNWFPDGPSKVLNKLVLLAK